MPPWIWVTLSTSRKTRPVDVDVARLELEHRRAAPRARALIAFTPSHGPRRVRGAALEDDARVEVAEAAELERVVGRLEADHERRLVDDRRRLEHGRQRVVVRAELLAREEEQPEVVRELGLGRPARELDHHREAALHVGRAEPVHGAVLDPAGQVPLRRHGVGVAGEQHERLARRAWRRAATRRRRRRARQRHVLA